ncbi:MAG: BatA domain-containing protein [Verrucomicrobiota bacterium]
MTFLEPSILWGLPLVLIPVIIHLINRLRHRPQPWAAMQFLILANRSSTSHAKLRQWLILLFRVLAVLMLVLFLSRPLAGGWLGWALSPAPDAIVILLDRSASMETTLPGSSLTRRQQALTMLTQAARQFDGRSHLVLIDSALRAPQSVANADALAELPQTAATDTAADLPAMLQTAVNWLIDNRAGTTELWIASDLQRSNWKPDDERWGALIAQLSSLQQRVRVRLLAFEAGRDVNTVVALQDLVRRAASGRSELRLALDLHRNVNRAEAFPLSLTVDGARSEVDVKMDGQSFRWRHQLPLAEDRNGGWGKVELPADANARDNIAWFVYGPETMSRTAVVSDDAGQSRYFRLAALAAARGASQAADVIPSSNVASTRWDNYALVIWQLPLPQGETEQRLRAFAESGGVLLFVPPGEAGPQKFAGTAWGGKQLSAPEKNYRIAQWEEKEGPLAKTDEGLSLPVPELEVRRRQQITGERNTLASFDDGEAFLVRHNLGRGQAWFCATLPGVEWSTLGEGLVLVPMTQRLLQTGTRRLTQAVLASCGELSAVELAKSWTPVDATGQKDIRVNSGIYRSGDRLVAVNRPATEDEAESLESAAAQRLFGVLPFQMLTEERGRDGRMSGEVWRMFLGAMLLFLLVEAVLILPPAKPATTAAPPPGRANLPGQVA